MTSQECSTPPQVVIPLFTAEVLPDQAANIAAAQHTGDLAYAFAERAGAAAPDPAIA